MKNLSALLAAAMLACALGATASAANNGRIGDLSDAYWDGRDGQEVAGENAGTAGGGRGVSDLNSLNMAPGGELQVKLWADMFVNEDGEEFADASYAEKGKNAPVTLSELRKGKVTLSVKKSRNASFIDEIALDYDRDVGTSYIKVKMVDHLSGGGRRTAMGNVQLKVGGDPRPETAFAFEITIGNTKIVPLEGTDYINMEGAYYVQPDEYLNKVTADIGSGVSIMLNMFPKQRYYGRVDIGAPDKQAENAEIAVAYTIVNSNLSGGVVHFDLDEDYYVYNSTGAYLGTTRDDALAFSRVYYMTRQQVDALDFGEQAGEGSAASGGGGRGGR